MHPSPQKALILAIDLRPQRFGYAVFEGPKRLLDWGGANYRPGGKTGARSAQRSTAKLLAIFTPSAIALRIARRKRTPDSPGVQPILRGIRRAASIHNVPIHTFSRRDIRKVFSAQRARTKHEIAASSTVKFPELLSRLPPEREIYESEPSVFTVFDAVALGVTYWETCGASPESLNE
jgi:hypothetical protein